MRSNTSDGRITRAVSERNKAIIKRNRSGCAGKYDKRLIVVTIAWRQSGQEVRVEEPQHNKYRENITKSTLGPAEWKTEENHDREEDVVFGQP